jgi:hypothetical protein
LEFYDFSRLTGSNVAPTLFVEVFVAEVLTQSQTPFAEPRGMVARRRSARKRGVIGSC